MSSRHFSARVTRLAVAAATPRLFRPTLSDLECVAEPIPPLFASGLHSGNTAGGVCRIFRAGRNTTRERAPDPIPIPRLYRTRRALPRTPLRYLPTTSPVARPSAAARRPLAPSPRGTAPPRARVFLKRSVLLRLHLLQSSPPPPLSRWTRSTSRSHRLSDDRRRRSRFRAARSRVAPPGAVPREPPASTPTTHPANATPAGDAKGDEGDEGVVVVIAAIAAAYLEMASISSSARALRFEHELRAEADANSANSAE